MEALKVALKELHRLGSGDAEDLAALDEVLDLLLSALEESGLVDSDFDLGDAFGNLKTKGKMRRKQVEAAELLVELAHEVRYGEFPDEKVYEAQEACGIVAEGVEGLFDGSD